MCCRYGPHHRAAKGGPAVKGRIFRHRPFPVFRQGQIQVVVFNEFRQIPGAQVVLSLVQASARSRKSMPCWLGMTTASSSGTRLAIQ